MSETNLATSFGDKLGLNKAAVDVLRTDTVAQLSPVTPSLRNGSALRLNPENPFGITAIIGGTNVRFCISIPEQAEPIISSVKWQELNNEVAPILEKTGREFGTAKDLVFPLLAKRLVDFVASHYEESPEGPPFSKLCAFNFSVAGIVQGEGADARISTTNTGLIFKEEAVAIGLMEAINAELQSRNWAPIAGEKITVMNDAAAGLKGEMIDGGLKNVDNGLFVILGTGVGSMGLVDGKICHDFDEAGHRVVWDAHIKRYVFHSNAMVREELLNEFEQFRSLPPSRTYAENELAGPWAAIRFAKLLKEQHEDAFFALASRLSNILDRPQELVERQLEEIIDLNYRDRTRWAVNSPSDVIKAVNRVLFTPDAAEVFAALPCDSNIEDLAVRNPDDGLTMLVALRWKTYFKRVGDFLGSMYKSMAVQGHTPERIVLAGGIGELCNTYDPLYKKVALGIIHRIAEIPEGTVVFSSMSPEQREAMFTKSMVSEEQAKLVTADVARPNLNGWH